MGMGPGEALGWPWPHAGQDTRQQGPRDEWELDLRVAKGSRERSLCQVGTRSSMGQGLSGHSGVQDQALPDLTPECIEPPCTPHLQDLSQHPACASYSGCHQHVTQEYSKGLTWVNRGGTKDSSDEMTLRASGWGVNSIPAARPPPPPARGCWASPTIGC